MARPVSYTDEQRAEVCRLFEQTDLTLDAIAAQSDLTYKIVWTIVERSYSPERRLVRKQQSYRDSKLGDKNPSFGRAGENAFHYKSGKAADGKGYMMITKPEWYTGRAGSKYVFEHSIVMCQALGLTEMPAGFVIHHIDGDKTNNSIDNLALMTNRAHSRLHSLERVETIRKE